MSTKKNICVIGASGLLGSELMNHSNTIAYPLRFEDDLETVNNWFLSHPDIDTIWHVARSCRKDKEPRRDHKTFLSEINGMANLLRTRAKDCRFVYASTKVVYGIDGWNCCEEQCNHNYTPLTVSEVANYFVDDIIGVVNCPEWQKMREPDLRSLNQQRTTYVLTKLSNEAMIKQHCKNYKIIRIWDIKK